MYRMLIADDESWTRQRLTKTIDWASIEVEVIAESCDGEDALIKTRSLLPDIVLTDIRMPCINGLEFIAKLREEKISTKVIIISGYNDFEYAKKAIQLGAANYILKPVEDEELIDAVCGCIEKMNEERMQDTERLNLQDKLTDNISILKEKFLINLVNGYFSSDKWLLSEINFYEIDNSHKTHLCFVIQLDDQGPEHKNIKEISLIQYGICNIAREFLQALGTGNVVISQLGEVICIVTSEQSVDELSKQVVSISNELRELVKKNFSQTVTIGIGDCCTDMIDISISYQKAKQALLYRSYLGTDSIYESKSMDTMQKATLYEKYDVETLKNHIMTCQKEKAIGDIDEIIFNLRSEGKELRPIDLKFIYMDIMFSTIKGMADYRAKDEKIPSFDVDFFNKLNDLQSMNDFEKYLKENIERLVAYRDVSNENSKRKVVDLAIEYIKGHYREQVTLTDVANQIFFNPTYFCKVFKNEMGELFSKYLMKYRIQKATELLEDPRLKIYEISELVGYSDVQYFTKVFKQIKGVSPTQYRDKIV